MANTKSIGVAFEDQNINGADIVLVDAQLGYTTTGQGTVTQATSKSTAVTLNNSLISVNDILILNVAAGATAGAYNCWVSGLSVGSASITVRNISGGSLSEAVVLNFALIHCA